MATIGEVRQHSFWAHPSFGIRAVKRGAPTLDLGAMPTWWLRLDSDERAELEHTFFADLLTFLASRATRVQVEVGNDDDIAELLKLADLGAVGGTIRGRLSRPVIRALTRMRPRSLLVTDDDGQPFLDATDGWQRVLIIAQPPDIDALQQQFGQPRKRTLANDADSASARNIRVLVARGSYTAIIALSVLIGYLIGNQLSNEYLGYGTALVVIVVVASVLKTVLAIVHNRVARTRRSSIGR